MDKKKGRQPAVDASLGLGGVFRGLGSLIQMAADLVDTAGADGKQVDEQVTTGRPDGVQTKYGVSVRVGGLPVAPPRRGVHTHGRMTRDPGVEAREPNVDTFDEDDHYMVVAELPGVEESGVEWSVRAPGLLVIHAESADRRYSRAIELLDPVDEAAATARFANGVLELRLPKQRRR